MSEQESITVVQKEKNPKRVEGGKKLAAYNKAAREKMLTTSAKQEVDDEQESGEGGSYIPLIAGVGIVSGLVYLYLTRGQNKKPTTKETLVEEDQPKTAGKKKLISFD